LILKKPKSLENANSYWFTPDCSENPFCFFFKNKKIVTKSGYRAGKMRKRVGAKKKTSKQKALR
jgi:hypothetical protein